MFLPKYNHPLRFPFLHDFLGSRQIPALGKTKFPIFPEVKEADKNLPLISHEKITPKPFQVLLNPSVPF